MIKFAKIVDDSTGMCAVGLGDDARYYLSIGMTALDVSQGFDGAWYLTEKLNTEEYRAKQCDYRKSEFEKDFFETSLGWIRRVVNMKNGEKKDFLSDLLLQIKTGLELGQKVSIITYKTPDYTNELSDEYVKSLQQVKPANLEFIKECLAQTVKDWEGI